MKIFLYNTDADKYFVYVCPELGGAIEFIREKQKIIYTFADDMFKQ